MAVQGELSLGRKSLDSRSLRGTPGNSLEALLFRAYFGGVFPLTQLQPVRSSILIEWYNRLIDGLAWRPAFTTHSPSRPAQTQAVNPRTRRRVFSSRSLVTSPDAQRHGKRKYARMFDHREAICRLDQNSTPSSDGTFLGMK